MKILFVDDEKIIREGMAELIDWEKLGCDKPAMAESADKALRLLREEPFDLVITDIYMSKMSGIGKADPGIMALRKGNATVGL
ncbi:response regulator [[Clostridium] symbiosum]|nr:response regulator [[Clostridium] symbiosum]MDB1976380.1 response regulator [[Clostridium] symbiosum]MDB1981225.1 response regulator [[Clostridium] symbiosum]MDB1994755.1 response regulator [[Clostridium] symbiosum]MDB2003447.1 response regulator [[Clostridium] symbiosum]